MAPTKVTSACVRCRRQKLKCDVERPCTMCSRAGVECARSQPHPWLNQGPELRIQKTRRSIGDGRTPRGAKHTQERPPAEQNEDNSSTGKPGLTSTEDSGQKPSENKNNFLSNAPSWRNSTSTLILVEEAFHHHDTTSPEASETSALCYSHPPCNPNANARQEQPHRYATGLGYALGQGRISHPLPVELASLLPNHDAVTILVDNYFDKIHWFMLLFHQREFRASLEQLYAGGHPASQPRVTGPQGDKSLAYIGVLLATCALSLRYVAPNQHASLVACGIDPQDQREQILAALRLHLLDILALGSLEAVQICILLGSYYLYHGEPELAWPLCGCALRLSQALELHRHPSRRTHAASSAPRVPLSQQAIEVRKRCWWALHEIDTFCSMVYGFPLSFKDADCDADCLDPWDPWSIAADGQLSSPLPNQPTLLVYKGAMSELSKIVKAAIEDLYNPRQEPRRQFNDVPTSSTAAESDSATRIHGLVRKVASLDSRLVQWYSHLPSKLKLGKLSLPSATGPNRHEHPHRPENPRRASLNSNLDDQLFRLQALALKLAFENARILVHRPLLSYKISFSSTSVGDAGTSRRDPYLASIHVCRDAAIQISCAGSVLAFKEASTTYALNFISIHMLTAGVTLCIMASLNPLSQESLESKLGVRRVMEMQASLKPDSLVAEQGLEILKKLSFLVMKKETDTMLGFESETARVSSRKEPHETGRDFPTEDTSICTNIQPAPAPEDCSANSVSPGISSGGFMQSHNIQQSPSFSNPSNVEISSFCEDLLMTQVMFDVEQAMGYSGLGVQGLTQHDSTAVDLDGSTANYESIGYDQSWLWGPISQLQQYISIEFGAEPWANCLSFVKQWEDMP